MSTITIAAAPALDLPRDPVDVVDRQCVAARDASDAMPEAPAANGTDSGGVPGKIIAFDRKTRRPRTGRAGAARVVRVVVADGHVLVRAGYRALLQCGGRIDVVGEASS